MKRWHPCQSCGKTLSSYKSLWRHRNTCSMRSGHGLRNSENKHVSSVSKREKAIDKVGHEVDDDAEKVLDDLMVKVEGHQSQEKSEAGEDDSMISSGSDSENSSYDSDSSRGSYVDTDDILWRSLAFFAEGTKKRVLGALLGLLYNYKSNGGKLFHKMLDDVEYAENSLHYLGSKAIRYGVRVNKEAILEMLKSCEKHRGNHVWCSLLFTRPCCRLNTSEICKCCNGLNALDRVRVALEFYYGVKHDDLMKKINNDIDSLISENKNGNPLEDIIYHVIDKYREEILEQVDLMHNTIDEREWEIHFNHNFDQDGKEDHKCTHKYNCIHR